MNERGDKKARVRDVIERADRKYAAIEWRAENGLADHPGDWWDFLSEAIVDSEVLTDEVQWGIRDQRGRVELQTGESDARQASLDYGFPLVKRQVTSWTDAS